MRTIPDRKPAPDEARSPITPDVLSVGNEDRPGLSKEEVMQRCIAGARAGDRDAVLVLYDEIGALLLCLATRITRDTETGRDVVQDVLLRVWDEAEHFDPSKGSALSWLTTMTRNRAIDMVRKHNRKAVAHAELASEPQTPVTSPEHDFAQSERQRRVLLALHTLPKDQRDAMELMYYHGLSHAEVADQLVLPLGTVKTRVLLAMKKLREALTGEEKDWGL